MDLNKIIESEKRKYDYIHSVKSYYGRHTPRKKWFTADSNNEFVKKVFSILYESNDILDVGCGKGSFMDHFYKLIKDKKKIKITGVDISEEAARSRKDVNIIVSCASSLPFSDNSFDVTYHFDGMEHIPIELEDLVIKEQFRVSRKYIIHSISTDVDKYHDEFANTNNMTNVHVNVKSPENWRLLFLDYCKREKAEIVCFDTSFPNHVNIIIKK